MKLRMVNSLDGLYQYNKLIYNFYILKFYYNADIILTVFTFNIYSFVCYILNAVLDYCLYPQSWNL
jgi:hypothetical protein